MKKEHSQDRSRSFQPLRTFIAMVLNLLLILGPIVSVSSVAKAEVPEPQRAAEDIPETQSVAEEVPEPQQGDEGLSEPQQAAEIDAAFFHTGEKASYFFQGDHYYRLTETKVDAGYPKKLPGEWKGLPESFHSGIDAAVMDPSSGNIYFFKGNKYGAFNATTKTAYPGNSEVTLPGGWRGLPAEFSSDLDAAIDEDGAVVFIKGNRRAIVKNESLVRVEDFSASAVTGVGMVNAAFKYSNGRNYFFSGNMFSRAIGFDKEPTQLNPVANTWTGVKPASSFAPIDPNATKVTYVSYGFDVEKGHFEQVAYGAWEHRDKQAGSIVNCDEVRRGSEEIELSCATNSYRIVINLRRDPAARIPMGSVNRVVTGRTNFEGPIQKVDTFEIIADADLKDPFRPGDIQKIMAWISKETSNSRLDYCYKNTMGRGVGAPLTNCPAGMERNGALCYPNCRAGFAGNGPQCRGVCPQGFTDIGLFCQKTEDYQRETFPWRPGYPPLPQQGAFEAMLIDCEKKYGKGSCEIKGSAAYPKCKAGYKEGGAVTICASACPAGWADTGTGCTKPSYDRPSTPMICAPGLQEQAGLCYQNCSPGYGGVGPVCWQQCTGAQRWNCGIGCSSDESACASATADMVLAPFNLVVGLFSMGISNKVKAAADAAKKAAEAAKKAAEAAKGVTGGTATIKTGQIAATLWEDTPKWVKLHEVLKNLAEKSPQAIGVALDLSNVGQGLRDEIELWTDEYEDNFAENTSPAVESRIRSQFDYSTQRYIKRYYALHHLGSILEADGWRIGKLVMTVGGVPAGLIGDPGFIATINAYAQPMCPPVGGTPFPRVMLTSSGPAAPPSGTRWDPIAGNLVQVSVANDGTAWGVDKDDNIYQWTGRLQASGTTWANVPGKLKQISVGSEYFVVGVNSAGEIYSRLQNGWERFLAAGPMKQVSIGSDGKLWGVDTADNIYRWDFPDNNFVRIGGGWFSPTRVPGKLKQISVGNAEDVWGVNAGGEIFRWDGRTWIKVPGVLKQVSVGSDGSVWGVNQGGEIFRWTNTAWEKVPGGLNNISVADSGLVWGVNVNNQIFTRTF